MYLVDTNVWLERLLNQSKSDEVGKFLSKISSHEIYLTDFAFHSICVILGRLARTNVLLDFVHDVVRRRQRELISIKPSDVPLLVDAMNTNNFDFDDAYQYVAAQQYRLRIISFDSDFDRVPNLRATPATIMDEMSEVEKGETSE